MADASYLDAVYETGLAALKAASSTSLARFRKPIDIDLKDDESPVTVADREAEAAARAVLDARFPEHGFFGEESGSREGAGGTWIVDPIDGTKSFLLGNPLYGCLIGYLEGERAEVGFAGMPALGEVWSAVRGRGAFLDGARITVSGCERLSEAALLTTSPDFFAGDQLAVLERVSGRARFRRYGGDCYVYLCVAAGWADVAIEASLQPYDYLPLVPIVEEAGGVITDWQGNPLTLSSDGRVVASATRALHDEVLALL
ncbi:MAG: histidinol phosphate phosphatase [Hyphomicrobiales bacterium]|nr:MAG: histidinol phosphate phosphatase [Hyphomicrobiales bacterium]